MSIDVVENITPRVQYTAAALQTVFDYPFPIFAQTDLVVYIGAVLQVLGTNYTVAGVGADHGGTITFVVPRTAGQIVTLYRDTTIERITDFQQNGPNRSAALNDELDRITVVQQELKSKIGRALRFPFTAATTDAQQELSPISSWLGKFLRISAAGILEAAEVVSSVVALTQSVIGALLNPQTLAEAAAGIDPPNKWYRAENVLRYGTNSTPGTTDMTTAINNALVCNDYVWIPAGVYLITASLIMRDNTTIEGAGFLNTIIKGNLASKSFFRSAYGESPTIGQRPVGICIAKLGIFPLTAATITSGSIGVNFRNAQYCTLVDVLVQYVDIGIATDQIAQYNNYLRVIVQVANTGASLASIGGGNKLIGCDIAGNTVAADFNGGAYDIVGGTYEALTAGTTYCMRFGRPGGQATYFTATGVYIEGINAATVPLQFENSVIGSYCSAHLHSTLGAIVNNATEGELILHVRGYYNPIKRVLKLSFSTTLSGAQTALIKSGGGNYLMARNATDTDGAFLEAKHLVLPTGGITGRNDLNVPNILRGTVAITDPATSAAVAFGVAQSFAAYHVFLTLVDSAVASAATSVKVLNGQTVNGFTAVLNAAPGGGKTVTVNYLLIG